VLNGRLTSVATAARLTIKGVGNAKKLKYFDRGTSSTQKLVDVISHIRPVLNIKG